jgi:serine phosphatase RsbU (regulator of sigma subunit)/pSer/pThr/pTyr-binding forkhead associated (FHA) protein
MASLQVLKGPNPGKLFPLDVEEAVLGRNATCQVVINIPAVSREHAVVRCINGQFYIEDMQSRNGTFVNNQEIKTRTLLRNGDRIKICDNLFTFQDPAQLPPLPASMRRGEPEPEGEDTTSNVEASIIHPGQGSGRDLFGAATTEKYALLLDLATDLYQQTFNLDQLLPKIVEQLFSVFRQADRGFVILAEEGTDRLIPKVIRTRHQDETTARFSRRIVQRCLKDREALLSGDAVHDPRFDLSQSVADFKIRSVMCAPLIARSTGAAFGVIQLDTQNKVKKFTQEDLRLLLAVTAPAATALENAQLHESLVARAGLERDMKLARQVQLSFLPKKSPVMPTYEFFAHYEPALEVGGDYYDFIPLPGERLGIALGDVAGKGVPAALLMGKVSSDARFCFLTEPSPAAAVSRLNVLMQEAGLLDRFVTLTAALLEPVLHKVTFVNAGHLPPMVFRKRTGKIEEAMPREMSSYPLGVMDNLEYEAFSLTLDVGDSVILFTDGVSDAKNKLGEDFQSEGAHAALLRGPSGPKAMGERLIQAVRQHALGCKQYDDITVVCFGRTV